jgi:hypothetical protein
METEARSKVAGLMVEWLRGGTIVVSDGNDTASAPAEVIADGTTVVLTAVFDERTANFHWRRREVRADDGTLVDALEQDYGEKMFGAIWTLEVPLEVGE